MPSTQPKTHANEGCSSSDISALRIGDSDFDFYAGFDGDGGDLLDDLRWRVEIDHALVDAHLEPVPSFGTFTAGRFTGGDAKSLGGNSHRTLDLELLVFGALDQIGAHLFQALHISRSESNSDAVDDGLFGGGLSSCGCVCFHFGCLKSISLLTDVIFGFVQDTSGESE